MGDFEDTWASRDLPILRSAVRRFESGGRDLPDLNDIRAEVGLTSDQMWNGVQALANAQPPYLEVQLTGGWSEDSSNGFVRGITERARRELGLWPSADNLVDALAAALREAAEAEAEPEKKGRLRTAAEVVGHAARDVLVSVAARRLGDL